jgi:hypothetical protein
LLGIVDIKENILVSAFPSRNLELARKLLQYKYRKSEKLREDNCCDVGKADEL